MKEIKISKKDLENFVNRLENFLQEKTTKAIHFTDKELHIMTMTKMLYTLDKKDKGLQYANKLIDKCMKKMLKNIDKCMKELI